MTRDYNVIKVLGKGGMSAVFLAEHVEWHTLWAIKQIRKDQQQFFDILAEPNILKQLSHPMLPLIIDVFDDDQSLYMVEEYIEGQDLKDYSKEHGPVEEETVISWMEALCDVLHYLHTQKPDPIIYRDLKPANIMIRPDGSLHLIDFGIARHYKEGSDSDTTLAGTRGYAAPEQFSHDAQTDARSDIYSLGVTMYQMVTGKSPYDPPYEIVPIRNFNPDLSEGLEYIIHKCTRNNPEERYQTVSEIRHDLDHIKELWLEDSAKREKKKKRGRTSLVLAVCLILAAGSGWFAYGKYKQWAYEKQQMEAAQKKKMDELCRSGKVKLEKEDYEGARDTFRSALDLDENYSPAILGMGDSCLGISRKAKTLKETEEALDEAKLWYDRFQDKGGELDKNRQTALDEVATLYEYRKQYEEAAVKLYKALEEKDFDLVYDIIKEQEYKEAFDQLNSELAGEENGYYLYEPGGKHVLAIYEYFFLYVGEWKDGKKEGKGFWYYTDEKKSFSYEGPFKNDKPEGEGVYCETRKEADTGKEDIYPEYEECRGNFHEGYYDGTFNIFWRMNNGTTRAFTPVQFDMGKAKRLSQEELFEHYYSYHYNLAQIVEFIQKDEEAMKTSGYYSIATCRDSEGKIYTMHENKDAVCVVHGFGKGDRK